MNRAIVAEQSRYQWNANGKDSERSSKTSFAFLNLHLLHFVRQGSCFMVDLNHNPQFNGIALNLTVSHIWNTYDTYERRTKLLTTRNGHGESGWSPIGCEGLYFHGMYKKYSIYIGYRMVSASGWSPIGCEGFYTNLNIPCPLLTSPYYFNLLLISFVTHIHCNTL